MKNTKDNLTNQGYNAEEAYFAKKNKEAVEKLKNPLLENELKSLKKREAPEEPETPIPRGLIRAVV